MTDRRTAPCRRAGFGLIGERPLTMAELLRPDICVIGAGSGGLSVAAAAAAFGVPVVLVEQGKMGGDCLNYGCVPSKALIAAGKHAKWVADAPRFGIHAGAPAIDFAAVHAHVHDVIAAIALTDSAARFTGLGVRVLRGHARFADADTVVVDETEIKARRFVVATGSAPAVPPIPGLADTPYLTNETVFDLTERPGRLVVIGGGPIGLELGQAFRRLGAAVTVIEAATPLGRDDPECAAVVLETLRGEGVAIRAGQSVTAVKPPEAVGGDIAVTVKSERGEETVAGTHLLIAVGRKPNVDDLGLDRAGIAYGRSGIVVDKGLRTSNRRVYAIGDVAGGRQFTHVANYHAGLVIRNALFRLPVRVDDLAIPAVTFTDPELAQTGWTEAEAKRHGFAINVLRWPYHENDRAQAERQTHGHIKAITTRRGRVLGATIVGAHAGELIAPWTLAIRKRLTVRAFAELTVAYPTFAEIGKRAAVSSYSRSLTNPLLRRIITLLRRLG
jgi:pyruvate/2-oxoglutarate dehydrogenase complex dihydrolipoamide dehydrogenase (E3) component